MTFSIITLEHGKLAQTLDFVAIAAAATGLGVATWATGAGTSPAATLMLALAGLLAWTLLEYLLHRFVLHGVPPFNRWHALHHQRPQARIYAPTWLSGCLVVAGILAPLWWLAGVHIACAVTLGVVLGNLGYAVAHHVAHGGPRSARDDSPASALAVGLGAWRRRVRAWHLVHHSRRHSHAHYGVSTSIWDHVFGTAYVRPRRGRDGGAASTPFAIAQTPIAVAPTTLASFNPAQRESR